MRYLRKNTAVIVTVGPFYDKTDGVTIETALTITNESITLVADTDAGSAPTNILDNVTGATSGTDNDLNYISGNDAAGMMQLELSQANTNRNGRLLLSITDAANHCPVFHEFMILPELVYDSLILGTDALQVDTIQISGTSQTANDVGADVNDILADTNELQVDDYPTSIAAVKSDTAAILVDTGTTLDAALAVVDANVDAILADTGTDGVVLKAAGLNSDAVTEIQTGLALATDLISAADIADAVWDEALSGHTGSGSAGEALDAAGSAGDPVDHRATRLLHRYPGRQGHQRHSYRYKRTTGRRLPNLHRCGEI